LADLDQASTTQRSRSVEVSIAVSSTKLILRCAILADRLGPHRSVDRASREKRRKTFQRRNSAYPRDETINSLELITSL
jgi:hypothetical protein